MSKESSETYQTPEQEYWSDQNQTGTTTNDIL